MAITHQRLAGISRAISGRDNEIAQKDDRDASRHRARSMELRAERDGRTPDNEKQRQSPTAQPEVKPSREPTDGDAKTGRWNEHATQFAPIRNTQHTGNAGRTESQQEQQARHDRAKAANEAYLMATGRIKPAANRQQEPKEKERDIIVARQAEETKQREGLKTDQPAETARATTREGRTISAKDEERTASHNVIDSTRGGDGGKGRDGARPRGGGRGR